MAEYIERDAVKVMLKRECSPRVMAYLVDELCEIPAADVRPVVLCRDCRHRDPEDRKCDSGEMERQGCPFKVADNYFCAYGER